MTIENKIAELAQKYELELQRKMTARVKEMDDDNNAHYLIYRVLGITTNEGKQIDIYQNKGRFLYKYAGAFLEEVAFLCLKEKFPQAQKIRIANTISQRPKQFEIDCLIDQNAIEIKWRDATTDGDHITKEHTRIQAIKNAGYIPIRVMFYDPNREQANRIQATLKTIYAGVAGQYYTGEEAWIYIYQQTGIELKQILEKIAERKGH